MFRPTPLRASLALLGFALVGGFGLSGCNLITGASDLEIRGAGAASVADGGGGGASTGDGAASSNGAGDTGGGSVSGPICGDGLCGAGEDCVACTQDCGACAVTCGNGACDDAETCVSCPSDCGGCAPACGDQACNGTETCSDCPGDCGACPAGCGDGMCDAGETCDSCASDCGACSTCEGASDATTGLDAEEQAFIVLLNDYRAQNGLGSVTACTSLNRAAQGHSEDMRDQDYFEHNGLDGSSPWDRCCASCYGLGCGPQTAMAENIAAGNADAQSTFTQWRNSPGHNANMLGASFTVIGIGRATGGGTYGSYWTNDFGGDSEASCN